MWLRSVALWFLVLCGWAGVASWPGPAVAASACADRVYVTNYTSNDLSVFDAATNTPVARHEVTASADDDEASTRVTLDACVAPTPIATEPTFAC